MGSYKDMSARYQYNNDFNKATYDRIQLVPKKEDGQRIRDAAAAAGKSVSAFILDIVFDHLDGKK